MAGSTTPAASISPRRRNQQDKMVGFGVTCQPNGWFRRVGLYGDERLPQPVHGGGGHRRHRVIVELVRAFLSLHDHEQGNPDGLPPSLESLRWWLTSKAGRGRGPHQGPGPGVGAPGPRRPHHQGAREHGSPATRRRPSSSTAPPSRPGCGSASAARGKPDPRRGHGGSRRDRTHPGIGVPRRARRALGTIPASATTPDAPRSSSITRRTRAASGAPWLPAGTEPRSGAFRERQAAE